jgi:hypothetical protein
VSWGIVQVGRIYLRETYDLSHQVNATTSESQVSMEGMESSPPFTVAQVNARQQDLMAMLDRDLPVIFSDKDEHTAIYRVKDVGTKLTEWPEATFFGWNLNLVRIGTDNAVDMESRFGSTIRSNAFALTGERWHAPAVGAYGYFTGSSNPSGSVARVLANGEGTITVYRGIPDDINPIWGIAPANYLLGRVRMTVDGQERSGVGFRIATTSWSLTNGLVTVSPIASGGVLNVAGTDMDVTVSGTDLTAPWDAVTVLRNDFEAIVVRLIRGKAGSGRTLLDLTLRRGSRFVEGFLQTDTSGTVGVKTHASVTTTNNAATGYIIATSGTDRITLGSPVSFTGSTTGAISKATSTQFPFYVGLVVAGASPASGDSAVNLRDQYIGTLAEQTLAVKR